MIRILGAVCIFAASALLGMFFSESIRSKKERLMNIRHMFSEISDYIRWNKFTLKEIAGKLSENKQFSTLGFVSDLTEICEKFSFPKAWEEAVCSDKSLCDDEKSLLSRFGNSLGTTDIDGQISSINLYISEAEKMIAAESEKYKTKGKLYRSLGVAFGAMTGILMI